DLSGFSKLCMLHPPTQTTHINVVVGCAFEDAHPCLVEQPVIPEKLFRVPGEAVLVPYPLDRPEVTPRISDTLIPSGTRPITPAASFVNVDLHDMIAVFLCPQFPSGDLFLNG